MQWLNAAGNAFFWAQLSSPIVEFDIYTPGGCELFLQQDRPIVGEYLPRIDTAAD
jgi:hypothetical protein